MFASTDAKQTTAAATWCAFFPGETINLANQSGDFADVAKMYALAGATASATTGSDGLTVTMKAKAAVLCIVGVNKGEALDISVKTDKGYVSKLTADKNSADFDVQTSDAKVSLLSKQGAGVYYIVVPAGVKLSVYNGSTLIKTTKDAGLNAGKYYTLTTHDTKGKEYATINGEEVLIDWVQLWAGGPKFAVKNVAEEMTWTDAAKTGDKYVWGKNWRTPKADEVYGEGKLKAEHNADGTMKPVAGSPSFEFIENDGYLTLVFTGVQPGYTKNTLTLYNKNAHGSDNFDFWTASETNGFGCRFSIVTSEKNVYMFWISDKDNKSSYYLVRPVLAE